MKKEARKPSPSKRLVLSRETLRALELVKVQGCVSGVGCGGPTNVETRLRCPYV